MAEAADKFRLRVQTYSLASIIVALLLYVAAVWIGIRTEGIAHDIQEDFRDLLRDIAIAIAIGVYLMWTLDRLNARQIQAEVHEYIHGVGESFIKAVYGKQLPDELFRTVRTEIFDQNFVRTFYDLELRLFNLQRYCITAPDAVKFYLNKFIKTVPALDLVKFIVVQFSVSYETTNVSLTNADCLVNWGMEVPFSGKFQGLSGITSVLINGKPQIDHLRTTDPDKEQSHLTFEQPESVEAGKTLAVRIESYSVRPAQDREPWQVLTACKGLTANVIDHDTNSDILIVLDAPHLDTSPRRAHKDQNTNAARLRVTQFLLPFQGVTVYWRPAEGDGA